MNIGPNAVVQPDSQLWGAVASVCHPRPAGGGCAVGHAVPGWCAGAGHTPGETNNHIFIGKKNRLKDYNLYKKW